MTLNILPNARTQFIDGDGAPLEGGSVYFYVPNTSTLKDTWEDAAGTIPNSNPVILDADGSALIWGSGSYRQIVQDNLGNTIWDQITNDPGYSVVTSFSGTSLTSVTIGTGTKSFIIQPGLQFFNGGTLVVSSNASALNYMIGTVTSYNTTTGALTMNILQDGGNGTFADWTISVTGIQGPPGTVTSITIASANGFTGSSSGGGTPQLTLATSVTGIVKGNGTALSAATSGTDYSAGTSGLSTGIVKTTTATGALSIAVAADFPTLNQSTTGNAATVTTNANLIGPVTSVGNATSISNGVVTEAMQLLSDNTTANVSTTAHGYAPKAPNDMTKFLNGVGTYTTPVTTFTLGTSTTSLAIGTGSKTFTTQAGLPIAAGQFLVIPSAANAANYMFGAVTSYSGTTLIVNVTVVGGSGTFADWSFVASGPQGVGGTGTGTVNSGTAGQLTYYGTTGTTVSGNANHTVSNGAITHGVAGSVQGSVLLAGSTSGTTTLAAPVTGTGTMTLQAGTDTLAALGTIQTWTAAQSFNSSKLILNGSSSGTTTLNSGAAAGSSVLTLPIATDTLIGKATTDTLTHKTYDTAGTGNVFKINGTGITAIAGNTATVATTTGTFTSGHIATWDGSGNLQDGGAPSSNAVKTVHQQIFVNSGTYTPTTGMLYAIVEVQAAGGGGGGVNSNGAASGGGAGAYGRSWLSAATIGVSQTITIGAGGTAGTGSGSGTAGGTGGTTSFGSLIVCTGGIGGVHGTAGAGGAALGGNGGTCSAGDLQIPGNPGLVGFNITSAFYVSGGGGNSIFGGGAQPVVTVNTNGNNAGIYGAGGSGGQSGGSTATGGTGSQGVVIITEYCSQ